MLQNACLPAWHWQGHCCFFVTVYSFHCLLCWRMSRLRAAPCNLRQSHPQPDLSECPAMFPIYLLLFILHCEACVLRACYASAQFPSQLSHMASSDLLSCACSQVLLVLLLCLPEPALLHLMGHHSSGPDPQHPSFCCAVLGGVHLLAHLWGVHCTPPPDSWLVDLVSISPSLCLLLPLLPSSSFLLPLCTISPSHLVLLLLFVSLLLLLFFCFLLFLLCI